MTSSRSAKGLPQETAFCPPPRWRRDRSPCRATCAQSAPTWRRSAPSCLHSSDDCPCCQCRDSGGHCGGKWHRVARFPTQLSTDPSLARARDKHLQLFADGLWTPLCWHVAVPCTLPGIFGAASGHPQSAVRRMHRLTAIPKVCRNLKRAMQCKIRPRSMAPVRLQFGFH